MQERTFVDAHGVEVSSRFWEVDAPRAVVLIAHGASEHAGRYDRFARALNAAGYSAVAIDHRGQGRTSAVTGVGVLGPGGGTAVVDDLAELYLLVLEQGRADDDRAEILATLPAIERLVLRESPLTDVGFAGLAACRTLRDLNVPQAACTAAGVAALEIGRAHV